MACNVVTAISILGVEFDVGAVGKKLILLFELKHQTETLFISLPVSDSVYSYSSCTIVNL